MEKHRASDIMARSLRVAVVVLLTVTAMATVSLFLDDKHSTPARPAEVPPPASLPGFPFCFGDRMLVFLFCNVLLVLVAWDPSLVAPCGPGEAAGIAGKLPGSYQVVDREAEPGGGEKRELEEMPEEEKQEEVTVEEEQHEVMAEDVQEKVLQEEEQQQEDREEGDEVEEANVDELNRRFEDFIEKVKRGMRMEALHLARIRVDHNKERGKTAAHAPTVLR